MATEQILLSSSSFDGMRETGGFGQPLHTLYPQIRAVLVGGWGGGGGICWPNRWWGSHPWPHRLVRRRRPGSLAPWR